MGPTVYSPYRSRLEGLTIWLCNITKAPLSSQWLGSLRSYEEGKRLIKIELCVEWSLLRLSHVDDVVQRVKAECTFASLGINGFQVKAKSERYTAASSRCRHDLKYEKFTSSFRRLRRNIASKSALHDYFSSFNQSNWFVALSLTLPSSNLKLPILTPRRLSRPESNSRPPAWHDRCSNNWSTGARYKFALHYFFFLIWDGQTVFFSCPLATRNIPVSGFCSPYNYLLD